MSIRDAFARTVATAIQAFLGVLLASGLSGTVADLALVQQAGVAGLVATITFVHRAVQAWLDRAQPAV